MSGGLLSQQRLLLSLKSFFPLSKIEEQYSCLHLSFSTYAFGNADFLPPPHFCGPADSERLANSFFFFFLWMWRFDEVAERKARECPKGMFYLTKLRQTSFLHLSLSLFLFLILRLSLISQSLPLSLSLSPTSLSLSLCVSLSLFLPPSLRLSPPFFNLFLLASLSVSLYHKQWIKTEKREMKGIERKKEQWDREKKVDLCIMLLVLLSSFTSLSLSFFHLKVSPKTVKLTGERQSYWEKRKKRVSGGAKERSKREKERLTCTI